MELSPYHPLQPNKGFRVLSLEPAAIPKDVLRCSLLVVTLDDHPAYETLSYVWGEVKDTLPIVVDGHRICVSLNLGVILRYLRLTDRPRKLWIDALCINQNDLQERSNHVQYMKGVYARSIQNLVWLTADEGLISRGQAAMQHFGSIMKFGLSIDTDDDLQENYYEEVHRVYGDQDVNHGDDYCRAIEQLFSRPRVWSRVWIMQEIACAPAVQLLAGRLSMSWEEVEHFLDAEAYIKEFGIPSPLHGPMPHNWASRGNTRQALQKCVSFPQVLAHQRRLVQGKGIRHGYGSVLLDVLARFRYCDSTDPRDKIYGLFGLVSDTLGLAPRYNLPVGIVYADVAMRMMQNDNNLDLICQGPWPSSGVDQQERPSWVPDFTDRYSDPIIFAQRGIFNASGHHTTFQALWTCESGLDLHGCHLDSLACIGGPSSMQLHRGYFVHGQWQMSALLWMPDALVMEVIKHGNEWLEIFLKPDAEMPRTSPYSTPLDALEAYWRTLLMDCKHFPLRRLIPADVQTIRDSVFKPQLYESCWNNDFPFDESFLYQITRTCGEWKFAVTRSSGYFCMVPRQSRPDDIVALIHGGKVPVVLRPTGRPNEFWWIGPCYVHNHMDGEVWNHPKDPSMVRKVFRIF